MEDLCLVQRGSLLFPVQRLQYSLPEFMSLRVPHFVACEKVEGGRFRLHRIMPDGSAAPQEVRLQAIVDNGEALVTSMAFTPCGSVLMTAAEDDKMRMIRISADHECGQVMATVAFPGQGCALITSVSEGTAVAVAPRHEDDPHILLVDLGTAETTEALYFPHRQGPFCSLVHSRVRNVMCATCAESPVQWWSLNVSCSMPVASTTLALRGTGVVAISDDGNRVAVADGTRIVRLYDWRSMARGPVSEVQLRLTRELDERSAPCSLQFSPTNANELLVNMSDGRAILLRGDTVHCELRNAAHAAAGTSSNFSAPLLSRPLPCWASISPHGSLVAQGTSMARVGLYNSVTGAPTHLLRGKHLGHVMCTAWSPRHELFASSCRLVHLWCLE